MGLPAFKEEQKYNYGDYLSWPDNERWEIIEGTPYNMSPAPAPVHQTVLMGLANIIYTFLKGKPCNIYPAPFDVRLPGKKNDNEKNEIDEKEENIETVVQPDLLVVCDKTKIDTRGCKGAPDLIIEIISPSTARRDMRDKLKLYEKHGVKEYWLVYPYEQVAELFVLGTEGKYLFPERYGIEDTIESPLFPGLAVPLGDVFEAEEQ